MGLPRQILIKRVINELEACSRRIGQEIPFDHETAEFPIVLSLTMHNIPGYARIDGVITPITEHSYSLTIDSEYGYRPPVVRWESPIFHPNIMHPDDGGYVCTKLIDSRNFGTRLVDFIDCLEMLVKEPKFENPFGNEICIDAAYFYKNNRSKIEAKILPRKE